MNRHTSSGVGQSSTTHPRSTSSLDVKLPYICGSCGTENLLTPKDSIHCRDCGYRILYKKRTNKPILFEAR